MSKCEKRFAIIGAGMSGILCAIKLREAGHENIVIYEKADRIGGTWRDNRYPGLTCDVPAHAYTYEFAPNPEWSAYLVGGAEIQAYFEKVVEDYNVRPLIRFNSEIASMVWKGDQWEIETIDGQRDNAHVAIMATGVLHFPKFPDIKGLESFAGRAMHTAQWDVDVDLTGKRIGVIGNGSTGVQMVTKLGKDGHDIVHFQRSPQWMMPYPNFEYSEEDKAKFRDSVEAIDAIRYDENYWASIRRFTTGITEIDGPEMQAIEDICRDWLENAVVDPVLREKLRPTYRAACKRLIYSYDYYGVAQQPNVETIVCGISEIVPDGVIDNEGVLHKLDVLALATGFHTDRFVRPISIKGLNGRDIEDAWAERCAAYMAISIPDFPNLFLFNGPSSPVGNFSLIDVAERQWNYVAQLLDRVSNSNASGIVASKAAFDDYEDRRIKAAKATVFGSGCTSWYLDKTGVPITWPWDYDAFADAMAKPDFDAYDMV
ncbi:MAG: flavin-containing monooxygenase [Sphingomonadales bacterium]